MFMPSSADPLDSGVLQHFLPLPFSCTTSVRHAPHCYSTSLFRQGLCIATNSIQRCQNDKRKETVRKTKKTKKPNKTLKTTNKTIQPISGEEAQEIVPCSVDVCSNMFFLFFLNVFLFVLFFWGFSLCFLFVFWTCRVSG
jgi:hypothetical protein